MARKYWIVLALSLVLRLLFVVVVPLHPDDERAHWRYVEEIRQTGHPLDHSERWFTGNATYQAFNNPFWYYVVEKLCETQREARLLSVIVSMIGLVLFAKVCQKYNMFGAFLFLTILPASVASGSRVGGDCWLYAVILMMIYAYDKRNFVLMMVLIPVAANLRIEGIITGTLAFSYVLWELVEGQVEQYKKLVTGMIPLTLAFLIMGVIIFADRLPLLTNAHSWAERDFTTFSKVAEPLDQAFISLWFNYGIEVYFAPLILLFPAVLYSFGWLSAFVIQARRTWKRDLLPALVVLAMVGLFLAVAYLHNQSNGRYMLTFIPWMMYMLRGDR